MVSKTRFEAGSTMGAGRTGIVSVVVGAAVVVVVVVVVVVDVVEDVDGAPGTVGAGAVVGGIVTGGGAGSATVHDAITSSPFLFT